MNMNLGTTSPQSRQAVIMADFFTKTHRFSASVALSHRRLTDTLNDKMSDYLEVKDVYVSRIDKPSEILGTYRLASLIKRHIIFIAVANEADGISQEHKYSAFIGRALKDVYLSVGSFEIQGQLEIIGKFDLKAILAVGTTTFMPIFQGEATNTLRPDVNFTGAALLVNKATVEFFSIL